MRVLGDLSAKEPCISTKEPCISAKEPCISTKEPCIFTKKKNDSKENGILQRECDISVLEDLLLLHGEDKT